MKSILGHSLVSFKNVSEIKQFMNNLNDTIRSRICFELSYEMDRSFIESVGFLKGKVHSAHAPCPYGKYLPNFGSSDKDVISSAIDSIKETIDILKQFGGNVLVLHAGYTIDGFVPTDFKARKKLTLEQSTSGEYCDNSYPISDLYKRHLDITIRNLKEASKLCRDAGITLAVENLNPRPTYLFQVVNDFFKLISEVDDIGICIDIGHLWISSQVYGYNYLDALTTLLNTGRVVSTHIHDNNSNINIKGSITDSHSPIGNGCIPIKTSVQRILELSSAPLICEAKQYPLYNINMLHEYSKISP